MSELSHWLTCHSSSSERHRRRSGRGRGRGWRKMRAPRTRGGRMSSPHTPSPPRSTPEMHVLCLSGVTHSPPSFRSRTETQLTSQPLPIHICHRIIQHKGAQSEKDNYFIWPAASLHQSITFGGERSCAGAHSTVFLGAGPRLGTGALWVHQGVTVTIPGQWLGSHCSPSPWTWRQETKTLLQEFYRSFKVPFQYSWMIPAYNAENQRSLFYQQSFLFGNFPSVLGPQGTRWQDVEFLLLPWVLLPLPAILFLLPLPSIIFHPISGQSSSSPFPYILPSILAAFSCFCKSSVWKQTPEHLPFALANHLKINRKKGDYSSVFFPHFISWAGNFFIKTFSTAESPVSSPHC